MRAVGKKLCEINVGVLRCVSYAAELGIGKGRFRIVGTGMGRRFFDSVEMEDGG